MIAERNTVGVFSGRFDPPHLGHLMTILSLCRDYARVVVPILDYPQREACSSQAAMSIFESIFDGLFPEACAGKVEFCVNDIHMGKITAEQYDMFLCSCGLSRDNSVYLSGNPLVITHMESIGVRNRFIERSFDSIYSGTIIRDGLKKT
jgi:hypothetical protein